jgi:hypothetical protein
MLWILNTATARTDLPAGGEFGEANRAVFCELNEVNRAAARENALKGQKNWNGWRDNIINKYNNGTEGNLQVLFAHW